ncbi:MAG: acyl-ACP--UDP-N-acetylglucosamine O-acyltransferase [Phycisphaerales bacterium]|jgi:UDP-N-acetylglucosamine acyltransferase|nr:acyl-ACP--UDP-N-acetylglucosamine O-acyltransferase [Phycisphaerales bacterium]
MPKISPLAVIDPQAKLADDVEVGPFCVIGPQVTVGAGCRLINNVTLRGVTTIGSGNLFHPNCVIGDAPQDKKYKGAPTRLEMGNDNIIREAVTIHTGTEKGGSVTRVGNNNLLMVNAHLGHDVQLGSNCILANNVMVAGHVVIGDSVAIMGGVGIHHFVTVGDFAYLGAYSRVHHDVPPFLKVDGSDQVRGLNSVGLKRAGFSDADIEALEEACRELFYRDKPFSVAMAELASGNGATPPNPHVQRLVQFLRKRDQGRQGRFLESLRPK